MRQASPPAAFFPDYLPYFFLKPVFLHEPFVPFVVQDSSTNWQLRTGNWELATGSPLTSDLVLVLHYLSALHHEFHPLQRGDILQRVSIHRHDIRKLARFDCSYLI